MTLRAENPLDLLGLSDYYDVVPDLNSCKEGTLKDSEKQKVLQQVNYIRKIHGLKPVVYDNSYDAKTAKAALIIAANEALNHTPPSSVKCFSQNGYDGSANSNLYIQWFYGTNYPTSESSINGWIQDMNVEPCGHRRWLTDPFLKFVSFGRVDGASAKNAGFGVTGMTIYVISDNKDNLSGWDSNYVAYPYHAYPKAFFFDSQNKNWYLSFTAVMDRVNYWNNQKVNYTSASVEMKDDGGAVVAVSSLQYENDGYGVPNLIKWKASILPDKKYWVTVKNVDMGGVKKNFNYWFNVTDAPPQGDPPKTAPSLSNPANNATNQDINPTLSWASVIDATFYNLMYSTTSDFSANVTNVDNVQLLFYKPTLNENTKYFWKVCAANQWGTGPYSSVRNFTTKKLPYIPVVTLTPVDRETNVYEKTLFSWNKITGGTSYTLQIAKSEDFQMTTVEEKGLSDTTYNLKPSVLEPATLYYWRVRVLGMAGAGAWSTISSFWSADPSSVEDGNTENGIVVYPNPFNGNLNIFINSLNSDFVMTALYNSLGQKVLEVDNGGQYAGSYYKAVDMNSLPEGSYFLRISTNKAVYTKILTKIKQ